MEALVSSSVLLSPLFAFNSSRPSILHFNLTHKKKPLNLIQIRTQSTAIAAINDALLAADSTQVEISWQILIGAIAGVTPFVVAGIEFSKRIIAQRRCRECGGSGLVLKDNDYFRCPDCGGFLPWQSWRRFFWG